MNSNITKIALAAILGFALAFTFSCSDDTSGGGGGGDDSPATSGSLTINGLSSADGLYVTATADFANYSLVAAQSYSVAELFPTGAKISGGSVTLRVWKGGTAYETVGITDYSGNDQNVEFVVVIFDAPGFLEGNPRGSGKVTVNFSGGKATGTITGLQMIP